jgi:predicted RNA-binding Zn-ribbon protein involved in translation (DUF1610 family)
MPKIKMVCPYCGSDDVSRDATTRWSVEMQDWEITCSYDNGHCDGCDTALNYIKAVQVADHA